MTSVGEADQAIGADERLQSARHLVSRPELFATLFLLGILNALTAVLFPLVHSENPGQALSQLSTISFPTVAAIVVGLHLLLRSPDAPIKRCDWLAAAIVALLLLVPHRAGSWLAITGLALFSLGRDHRSTTAVAAASIFMALAASSFWGPILVQVFGSTFLAWDAALAAALLDVLGDGEIDRIGNVIVTSDQTRLLVMVWCSALPNLLYGFLWWTVLARLVRPARADI